jgi:hypothetical protein
MTHADNLYPGPENYPVPSFHLGAVTPPEVDPDEGETQLYSYSSDWIPVLLAASNQLLLYATWEGDHDVKILATERAANLKYLLQNPVYVGEREVPAPYWDDEVDVDDEQPADEQDWYGMVADAVAPADGMTFTQDAVIWLLTGFVALVASPTLVGAAAAAITFRTVAKRFILAFNRGDRREQFRIIIDQTDYGKVDTDGMTEGDIVEVTVNGLEDLDAHDILIVVTNPE